MASISITGICRSGQRQTKWDLALFHTMLIALLAGVIATEMSKAFGELVSSLIGNKGNGHEKDLKVRGIESSDNLRLAVSTDGSGVDDNSYCPHYQWASAIYS
jgi:hypothetical protein